MSKIKSFLQQESAAGILLIVATAIAIFCSNEPHIQTMYNQFIETYLGFNVGSYTMNKTVLHWTNDGLMAIFFFYIGIELKRELMVGNLKDKKQLTIPILGALGGVVGPALIFYLWNSHNSVYLKGWAIPAATDIAFALGILKICSKYVPKSARIFLLTLAICDDLAAIIIIAVFYTTAFDLTTFYYALGAVAVLFALNRMNVKPIGIYLVVGLVLWKLFILCGIHATLAGFTVAVLIPLDAKLMKLEKTLSPIVTILILPFFAFVNMGLNFTEMFSFGVNNTITYGVITGLYVGKILGVSLPVLFVHKFFKTKLPENCTILSIFGLAALAGIGFTMSLFISSLSYNSSELELLYSARFGIIVGSVLSIITGYIILHKDFKRLAN